METRDQYCLETSTCGFGLNCSGERCLVIWNPYLHFNIDVNPYGTIKKKCTFETNDNIKQLCMVWGFSNQYNYFYFNTVPDQTEATCLQEMTKSPCLHHKTIVSGSNLKWPFWTSQWIPHYLSLIKVPPISRRNGFLVNLRTGSVIFKEFMTLNAVGTEIGWYCYA